MKIKGFNESSLVDYPARICSVVFTPGCNFRCPFCHNPELIADDGRDYIDEEKIFNYLKKNAKWIDGVVISGGEPLIHADIEEFTAKVKALGMLVKIDTNGSNPGLLKKIIQKNLVDFIAMDIKSSPEKYEETTNSFVNTENIKESIKIIMESGIEYEFRTTVVPKFIDEEEIRKMAELIKGAEKFVLQQFRNDITLDESFRNEPHYKPEVLEGFKKIVEKYVKFCEVRGV